MTDSLIERLRFRRRADHGGPRDIAAAMNLLESDSELHRDAADAIERLEKDAARFDLLCRLLTDPPPGKFGIFAIRIEDDSCPSGDRDKLAHSREQLCALLDAIAAGAAP